MRPVPSVVMTTSDELSARSRYRASLSASARSAATRGPSSRTSHRTLTAPVWPERLAVRWTEAGNDLPFGGAKPASKLMTRLVLPCTASWSRCSTVRRAASSTKTIAGLW